jgi:ABC-type microcin C transport system permease subunit YejB
MSMSPLYADDYLITVSSSACDFPGYSDIHRKISHSIVSMVTLGLSKTLCIYIVSIQTGMKTYSWLTMKHVDWESKEIIGRFCQGKAK